MRVARDDPRAQHLALEGVNPVSPLTRTMSEASRRLAAVWFADLVGYSTLSSMDETKALAVLRLFQDASRAAIEAGGGRLVQFIGDAVFADFSSSDAALRAALDLRARFADLCREAGAEGQIRVGLHVGDVMQAPDGDLYGDGVNVAARLQAAADPGQVVVSQDVWRQLRRRRGFRFEPVGERALKGIATPVYVFEVVEGDAAGAAATDPQPSATRTRLRRVSKVARTGVVFLVAAAVILLSTPVLVERLGLPAWVLPAAAVLLAIGLVITLATAWAQSRPDRASRQHAPWDLDMADVLGHVSRQEIPELTWARTLVGGVAAFALLFGVAGLFVTFEGEQGIRLGPQEAQAAADPALAILPFSRPDGQDSVADGIPEMLSLVLDDVPGLRIVDPIVVGSRTRVGLADSAEALRVGRVVGARYAASGSVRPSGTTAHVEIRLYEVSSGRLLESAETEGPLNQVPRLVNELASSLELSALPSVEQGVVSGSVWDATTASPAALRAYLEGERHFRSFDLPAAIRAYETAVAADSTFALARYELALARNLLDQPHQPRPDPDARRALEDADPLPERERLMIRGFEALSRRSPQAIRYLSDLTHLYPDDPEGWFLLGDAYFHLSAVDPRAFRDALERAIELAPEFGPAYPHLIEHAVNEADTARARALVEAYRRADPSSPLLPGLDLAVQLANANDPQEAATPTAPTAADRARDRYVTASRVAGDARGRANEISSDDPAVARSLASGDSLRLLAAERAAEGDYRTAEDLLSAAVERFEATRALAERLEEDAAATPAETTPEAEVTPEPDPPAEPIEDDPEPTPPPAPAPDPGVTVAGVLTRLAAAMGREDMDAVRTVWTSVSGDEAAGLTALFRSVRDLSVTYQPTEIESTADGFQALVTTTYRFYSEVNRRQEEQSTRQEFRIARRGGAWVIVDSR